MKNENFDITLAKNCARAYSASTSLGTVISLASGEIIASFGAYHCENCGVCALAGKEETLCTRTQIYSMGEAERFGGKYVYFCPLGLTCYTSPIVGEDGAEAKVTVGPFLMVDRMDYYTIDLKPKLKEGVSEACAMAELEKIPFIPAERVEDMSSLMFMAVGFMNNVWAANHMLELQESHSIQKQVSSYLSYLKLGKDAPPYPFDIENTLLDNIVHLEREAANRNLNALLGYVFFSIGSDLQLAKSRLYELLVLISRAAITGGADAHTMLLLTHDYLQIIPRISSWDELCSWLAKAMNRFMDLIFDYSDIKHASEIHRATQYMREHFAEKITLESVASAVYLSPAYFSRIFRQETGETFNVYLNSVRIEQSKKLLQDKNVRLIDISMMVGFENQSYFTKVFKKFTGMPPLQYREKKCKGFYQTAHQPPESGQEEKT